MDSVDVALKLIEISPKAEEFVSVIKQKFPDASDEELVFIVETLVREALLDIKHKEKINDLGAS